MRANQTDPENLERWERIDGVIYDMTPPPTSEHQSIVGNLYREISSYLKGKSCKAFVAPFGVWLENASDDYVEPDITIICDPAKIHHKGCVGVPDMVLEVLSPSTAYKDKTAKLRIYKTAGVREYWIVDPANQFVEVYQLQENGSPTVYNKNDIVTIGVFEQCDIHLEEIFE